MSPRLGVAIATHIIAGGLLLAGFGSAGLGSALAQSQDDQAAVTVAQAGTDPPQADQGPTADQPSPPPAAAEEGVSEAPTAPLPPDVTDQLAQLLQSLASEPDAAPTDVLNSALAAASPELAAALRALSPDDLLALLVAAAPPDLAAVLEVLSPDDLIGAIQQLLVPPPPSPASAVPVEAIQPTPVASTPAPAATVEATPAPTAAATATLLPTAQPTITAPGAGAGAGAGGAAGGGGATGAAPAAPVAPTGPTTGFFFSPGTSTRALGAIFSVQILLVSGGQPVGGAQVRVTYDKSKLAGCQIAGGSAFGSALESQCDSTTGLIKFAAGQLQAPFPSGTITVATITFTASGTTGAGGTPLSFVTTGRPIDVTDASFEGNSLGLPVTSGSVVIS